MPTMEVTNELCPICKGDQKMIVILDIETTEGPRKVDVVSACSGCRGRGTVLVQLWAPGQKVWIIYVACIVALLSWSFVIIALIHAWTQKGG
jgi:hypothetical protein